MFLALEQDLPNNKIIPLPQFNNQVSIVNTEQYRLISNICPHQNSKIAKSATEHLRCPYHGMTFDCQGKGTNNNYELKTWDTYRTQTMLFDKPVDHFPIATHNMTLVEHRQDYVNASTHVIMDVFLDIDHIPVAHQGVYDQVGIHSVDNVSWTIFENGSIQYVPAQDTDHILESDKIYNLGAVWMAVYPGSMIEWQPGALFVTVACKRGLGSAVQVYKYRDTRYDQNSWDLNEQVWELAWSQDRALAEGICLLAENNLDDLKKHYRNWINHAV
jgi:phenylpropionate dioxygenase-like ring-hydroxylating dioxygenase large terminal subunit